MGRGDRDGMTHALADPGTHDERLCASAGLVPQPRPVASVSVVMPFLRLPLTLLAAALLTLALTAVPASAKRSSTKVAVGDQSVQMFGDPAWQRLKLKRTRYFVAWNVRKDPDRLRQVTEYVETARRHGVSVLLHVSTDDFELKKAKLPSVRQYRKEIKWLVPYFRERGVKDFGVWNEANHASQPTYKNPKRAADFFKEMYREVNRKCKSCKIVALDVLDQGGVDKYMKRWYRSLSKTWRNRARVVGIHNYGDVNRKRTKFTSQMIRTARSYKRNTKFWFTETGGLVEFGKAFKCSQTRAASRTKNVFNLAKRYRKSGVERIYLYNWFGPGCGETRQDAGLVGPDGEPRKAYTELRKQLRNYSR